MKKNIVLTLLLTAAATIGLKAQSYQERAQAYIKQYCRLAVLEQQRSGIPAAITLAQGIHETSAGASELATNANNHFGIKCKKSWTGETYSYTDDAPDECFRKYKAAEESYKDHSDYLATSPRYAELFKLSPTDYAAWAIGLRKCGYATNPKYATILIKLVEDYHLQEYTYVAMQNPGAYTTDIAKVEKEIIPEKDAPETASADILPTTPSPVVGTTYGMPTPNPKSNIKVNNDYHDETVAIKQAEQTQEDKPITYPPFGEQVRVHGLKAVYARKGDMPLEYALKHDIRYERLLEFNDISDKPLPDNMYLYLERKHARGMNATHIVKEGENMLKIAQYEGMQIKSIRMLNKLAMGEEPVAGTVLQLQEPAAAKPELVAGTQVQPANVPVPEPYLVKKDEGASIKNIEQIPVPAPGEEVVATIPAEPATETIVSSNQPATVGPEPVVNIANEKPVEEVIAEEEHASLPPQTLPESPKEEAKPADEFDALKARFDRVVYAKRDATTPTSEQPAIPPSEIKKETVAAVPAAKEPAPKKEETKEELLTVKGKKYYTVKKGDTAFSIAKRNNITMRDLLDMNDLDFRELKVGQKLRIQ